MAARCGSIRILLTAAIRSIVQVKEEKDLDSLFSGQKTTALTGPATGIDDFELIAFLVVEPVADLPLPNYRLSRHVPVSRTLRIRAHSAEE